MREILVGKISILLQSKKKLRLLNLKGGRGEGRYPHLQIHLFSHKFLTNVHMTRFHTKFH